MKQMRAVIYARCSTEEESQREALKKQLEEAKECVGRKGWLLVDVYVESRSGTTVKGRREYRRMYEDMNRDIFDIIVIKSQDRLMRNVRDWYLFADRMVRENKRLYLYLEQKFYRTEDALITGIKAILAEEYSRELSKKMNNAHRNRQKKGKVPVLTGNTYGYRKMPDQSIEILEEEAAVKRRMYELCAAGYGGRAIARILYKEGIVSKSGKPFTDSSILRMIKNPLNKGTVVMNRRHFDFESKAVIPVPEEEQFVYENMVPSIVTEELWERANKAIGMRRTTEKGEKRGRYRGRSPLTGKLFCGLCEEPYYRTVRIRKRDGKRIVQWRCKRYVASGRAGCQNMHLSEEDVFAALESIQGENEEKRKRLEEKAEEKMEKLLKKLFAAEMEEGSRDRRAEQQERKLERQEKRLLDKLLDGVISDQTYRKQQQEFLERREEIGKERQRQAVCDGKQGERVNELMQTLRQERILNHAYAMALLGDMKKITVLPEKEAAKMWQNRNDSG